MRELCSQAAASGAAPFHYSIIFNAEDTTSFAPRFARGRLERDIGVQAAPKTKDGDTQTKWNRPVNMTTQYESVSSGTGPDDSAQAKADPDALADMLEKTLSNVEAALQQNETVNIFTDAMSSVGEDDGAIGSKMENQLKELRNFTDLDYSKNKSLSSIDWHPTKKGVLAVSVCRTLSFDDRVEVSGQVDVAYVIIWEVRHSATSPVHPVVRLSREELAT